MEVNVEGRRKMMGERGDEADAEGVSLLPLALLMEFSIILVFKYSFKSIYIIFHLTFLIYFFLHIYKP